MTKKRNITMLLVAVTCIALIACTFSLVACGGKPTTANKSHLMKASDVFALAGVTTGALVDDMNTGVALAGEPSQVTDNTVIAELDRYMALVDSLVTTRPNTGTVGQSDKEGYTTMQSIQVPGLDGKWTTYALYYNEDVPATTQEVATSDEKDGEEEKEEDEYEAHINGIMVIDGIEYPIKGDIEREGNEQEIEFKAYFNEAKTDYVVFSQELESNESEFEYKIYKNDKFESSFELEIEVENYKNEFSIETKNSANEVVEFQIEKDTQDASKIKVEYLKNGKKGNFIVEATVNAENQPIYKYYIDGEEIESDRD